LSNFVLSSQTQITENKGRNSGKNFSKSETYDFSHNQVAHAAACALTPVACMQKLVDMHLLSQDFFTIIMSRITNPTKREQKSHHTRKKNPTSSLKMDKPGRETKKTSIEQDSDTKNCNVITLHNSIHLCEPPYSILNCLYRGPSIDYTHSPAYTCSGHSNEPNAESAIIDISRPAPLSANSLLVNEEKNNSPVVHATSSHQAWKIGANQHTYFETISKQP